MNNHLISFMIFVPLLGAILQALLPSTASNNVDGTQSSGKMGDLARWIAFASSLSASLLAIAFLISLSSSSSADASIGVSLPWVGSYAISYDVAIDGMNALLVLLVAIIFPVLISAEWNQKIAPRGMHGLLLVLQTAFFGTVCSQIFFFNFSFGLSARSPFIF